MNQTRISKPISQMDSTLIPFSLSLHQTLIVSLIFSTLVPVCVNTSSDSDYNTLVYKNCNNETTDSQTLSSLFQELIPHSSHTKFFKSTAGDQNSGVSGLFQCRGDLTNQDCYNCVNTLPEKSNKLCKNSVSARIQLSGCYFHYKTDESINIDDYENPKHELLHKICGEHVEPGFGFEELRDHAFAEMESGVVEGHGFYSENFDDKIHVMAQCEGHLGEECDCGECVSYAVHIAQEECGDSVSGQVYLERCYMRYSYYPYGIPADKGNGSDTGKTVAIVLGGAAALVLGFVFLKFLKSCRKKDDDF